MVRAFVFLVVVGCGSSASRAPEVSGVGALAVVDVTVVPMDHDGTFAHQTVIVRDGKITVLGPVDTTRVPEGAQRIDGTGKFLMPGLADMHVHTYDPRQLALFASMGVTTIRVMWGAPGALGTRDAIKAGEWRLAPSIYTAGPIVDGDPPTWPGGLGVTTPAGAADEVIAQHRAGYDFVKVYSKLPADAYAAIVAAAAKSGMPVIGHVPKAVGLRGALDANQRSIEHLDGYAAAVERADSPVRDTTDFKQRMSAFKYSDPAKLADAISRTKAAGTWNCPTLVVLDRVASLDHPDTKRPEYRFVPSSSIASWDPSQDFRFRSTTADDYATMRANHAWARTLVKQLSDAGAGILAGTDVGNPWLVPGFSLHQELEELVAAKLSPYQALRAATLAPAQFLHAETEVGTIAVGRRADLVLVDGNPLVDITNTARIAGVMLRGRWLPAAELAAAREAVAEIYAGKRSRFDDATPAAPAPRFTARFRNTRPSSGEERVTVYGTDEALRVVGEMRPDGDVKSRWELELGPHQLGERMHVVQDGLDVVMLRDAGHVRVTGKVGADSLALDEPIADDEIFAGPALGVDVAYQRQLGAMTIGQSILVKLVVLELSPKLALRRMVIQVDRAADSQHTKQAPTHVYAIRLFGRQDPLELDADGWLVSSSTAVRVD